MVSVAAVTAQHGGLHCHMFSMSDFTALRGGQMWSNVRLNDSRDVWADISALQRSGHDTQVEF